MESRKMYVVIEYGGSYEDYFECNKGLQNETINNQIKRFF